MKLLVATRSAGKRRELLRLFAGSGVELVFPDDIGLVERPAVEDALELHDSYAANARAKVEYFSRASGLPTIADDSGLEVLHLGGQPGVRSRRFAGAMGAGPEVDAANNGELLRRLAGAPNRQRSARYRCVIAYTPLYGAPVRLFEGTCPGRILTEPSGSRGFGYDPLFFSEELGKTFGDASDEEKDRVSHRGIAVRAFLEGLVLPSWWEDHSPPAAGS